MHYHIYVSDREPDVRYVLDRIEDLMSVPKPGTLTVEWTRQRPDGSDDTTEVVSSNRLL